MARRFYGGVILILILAAVIAGCGGPSPETTELYSEEACDGSVTKTNTNGSVTYSMDISAADSVWMGMSYTYIPLMSRVPDTYIRASHRMLLSFDLIDLAGATIQSATLHVYLASTVGNPFTSLGGVSIGHVSYGTNPGALTASDLYDGYVVAPAVSGAITDAAAPAWKTIDVTAAVQADLKAGRAQFRLKHPENMSATSTDRSTWHTGDSTSFAAKLVVIH